MNTGLIRLNLIALMIFSWISPLYAWDQSHELPTVTASNYTPASGQLHGLQVCYSIWKTPQYMPIQPLYPGQALRIKILAPPGTAEVTIYAESGQWQGKISPIGEHFYQPGSYPLVGSFSYEAAFCPLAGDGSHCGQHQGRFIHPNQLHPVWAGLNEPIYERRYAAILRQPTYLYFVIYQQPGAAEPLKLTRLSIGLFIEDTHLYNQWHRQSLMGNRQEQSKHSPHYPIPLTSPQSWRDWNCCQ